jgi:hypothetical protein
MTRGLTNSGLKKYNEAIKDFNWAIFLRPQQAEPYKLRAIAKAKANNRMLLCDDILQARKLGADGTDELLKKYCR